MVYIKRIYTVYVIYIILYYCIIYNIQNYNNYFQYIASTSCNHFTLLEKCLLFRISQNQLCLTQEVWIKNQEVAGHL